MSNQTVREAAQAFLDEWGSGSGSLFDRIGDLKDALAQPEPTLCGMDEKTLDLFIHKIKHAYEYAQDGLSSASMIDLKHAIALLPVERKTWTVPKEYEKYDSESFPEGVIRKESAGKYGTDVRWYLNYKLIEAGEHIDVTDTKKPFIVGEQS